MGVYVFRNNQVEGPFDELVLQQALSNRTMSPDEQCCREGSNDWVVASKLFASPTPIRPQVQLGTSAPLSGKFPGSLFKKKRVAIPVFGCGGIIALFLLLAILGSGSGSSSTSNQNGVVRVEQMVAPQFQKNLDVQKQKVFDEIHPLGGTANRIVLNDVSITSWKHGQDTNKWEDVEKCSLRFTIFWTGHIVKDGVTKVHEVYDTETQKYQLEVLETNGITSKNLVDGAGALFGSYLQYQAEKAGAEQATQDRYNQQ